MEYSSVQTIEHLEIFHDNEQITSIIFRFRTFSNWQYLIISINHKREFPQDGNKLLFPISKKKKDFDSFSWQLGGLGIMIGFGSKLQLPWRYSIFQTMLTLLYILFYIFSLCTKINESRWWC